MSALDARERSALLRRLADERFDLLVVGGGITGAGIARDAALRGLTVALLEAEDFAAGTSNRSTKLIHGGLRYLAMGDFRLVREAALERKAVHAMAPHLAEPRWMVLPARSRMEALKYRVGVTVYERLGTSPEDVHSAGTRRCWRAGAAARPRDRFPPHVPGIPHRRCAPRPRDVGGGGGRGGIRGVSDAAGGRPLARERNAVPGRAAR